MSRADLFLKIAQQQRVTVGFCPISAQRAVQLRRDVFPDRVGFGQFIHGDGLLFARTPAHFGADDIGGKVLRGAMQPAREHRTIRQLPGVLRQHDGNTLCVTSSARCESRTMRSAAE